jgi:hypothetical protein
VDRYYLARYAYEAYKEEMQKLKGIVYPTWDTLSIPERDVWFTVSERVMEESI